VGDLVIVAVMLMACEPGPVATTPPPPAPRVVVPADLPHTTYTLSFPDAARQRVDVKAVAPDGCGEWWMPVWTPGSYLVREYARHVTSLSAHGPTGELPVTKVAKNRWRVDCGDAEGPVALTYQLFADELTVRTNHVDADGALLNGASTFLVPDGTADRPVTVQVLSPWEGVYTALTPAEAGSWRAADHDELVDSPWLMGDGVERGFEVAGVPHRVVTLGGAGLWDHDQAVADVQAIVEAQHRFWGGFPYPDYLLLNGALGTRGGLEHDRSTLILTDPWATRDEEAYRGWLGIVSHEVFHAWNVKAMRPAMLGPFDYEREVYTRELWIAEGFTSYYDDLLLLRAGLITEEQWLEAMTGNLERVLAHPGHEVLSLSDASFDAWIEYYRRDADSTNQGVSYYRKGAVVAWLLDTEIRRRTSGARGLDDVMRLGWERFATDGYTDPQLRALASEVAGSDLGPWFARHVDQAEPIDLQPALDWWGLQVADPGEPEPWLGIEQSGTRVSEAKKGGPGWEAGLNPGDELIAIDGWRVDGSTDRLKGRGVGEEVTVTISRRDQLRELPLTLGAAPQLPTLAIDADASEEATRRRAAWATSRPAPPG